LKSPPLIRKKPGATWTGATGQTENSTTYSAAASVQASLAQRVNGTIAVSQLLPLVLTKTLMTGFRLDLRCKALIQKPFGNNEGDKP